MAKFRSVPGTKIKGIVRRFSGQGFYETDDPKEIEILSKARYVVNVDEPKKTEKPEAPVAVTKPPVVAAQNPEQPKAKKGGK